MPRVRLTAKGRRRRVQDVLGWDEDRARSTREHSSSEFQPSPDKPHWAPSSLADRQKGGEGVRGGHVWFGVWFPLLCLANSLERRRFTAPGDRDFGETR